jgi:glycosyltransferase involved in cell wall biosynthesis
MRILFITPDVPWPANQGSRLRTLALLRALAAEHEVTLSAPATEAEHHVCRQALGSILAGFLPVGPDLGQRLKLPSDPNRARRLRRYLADYLSDPRPFVFRYRTELYHSTLVHQFPRFDAIFCRYAYPFELTSGFPPNRVVVDVDDLHYLGLSREAMQGSHRWGTPLVALETARSYVYEQRLYRSVAQALVCSAADARRVRSNRTTIVRNGVDVPPQSVLSAPPRPQTLVFVGQMAYGPNAEGLRWFLAHVWPRLCQAATDVRLMVVGRNANSETLPFAAQAGVELVGEVPDTAPWIASASLSIAPIRVGMGTRIKIIESLACARPVVSTRLGAEGLDDLRERDGLFRADDPAEMAARIIELLRYPEHTRALGARGRIAVTARYSWETVTRDLASSLNRWVVPNGPVPALEPTY